MYVGVCNCLYKLVVFGCYFVWLGELWWGCGSYIFCDVRIDVVHVWSGVIHTFGVMWSIRLEWCDPYVWSDVIHTSGVVWSIHFGVLTSLMMKLQEEIVINSNVTCATCTVREPHKMKCMSLVDWCIMAWMAFETQNGCICLDRYWLSASNVFDTDCLHQICFRHWLSASKMFSTLTVCIRYVFDTVTGVMYTMDVSVYIWITFVVSLV